MCGRFALSITPAQFQRVFGVAPPDGYRPRWNIVPDSAVVVVRSGDDDTRQSVAARWGLLGPWMKEANDPERQINVRSETAAEKPTFRDAFRRGRCLIPADGFYEWQKQASGPARPFFVGRSDGEPVAFAGLYRAGRLSDGTVLETCAILTTDAQSRLRPIHARMPVMLDPTRWDAWLDPGLRDPSLVKELLEPLPEILVTAHEVGRRVNNPRNDDAELVAPHHAAELDPEMAQLRLL
jgi:putative SOS response-associated peptidase YedK